MVALNRCMKLWVVGAAFTLMVCANLWAQSDLLSIAHSYKLNDEGKEVPKDTQLDGLLIEKLIDNKEYEKAQELLNKLLLKEDAPHKIIYFLLAKIAAKQARYKDFERYVIKSPMVEFHNLLLVQELYDVVPKKEQKWLINLLIQHNFFTKSPKSACPYFELKPRMSRANFLYQILTTHRLPAKVRQDILYELYVALPEVVSAQELKKVARFQAFNKALTTQDYSTRMEHLLTFGKNEEARQTFIDVQASLKKGEPMPCELDYIDAKTDRKMRKYDLAKKRFVHLASTCPADMQIKARYMYLLLASTQGDEKALPQFDAFVADYPTHSFSDDVLVFKASMLLEKGKDQEALLVLDQAIAQFPKGDMIPRALFLKAFSQAKAGQYEQAQQALAALKAMSAKDSLDYQQAQYWQARLLLFPNLFELGSGRSNALAQKQLLELAQATPPSVYSWLAESLLISMKKTVKKPAVPTDSYDAMIKTFHHDERLREINKAVRYGFRKEALMMLADITPSEHDIDRAQEMAWYFLLLNRPELGHQKLIRCDATLGALLEARIPQIHRQISYPFPYKDMVSAMEQQFGIQKEVIVGIMRQESGFIAESCSWAGAKGLMQLMYASAKSQAKRAGINNLKEEDLYRPEINLALGASLLKSYWTQWGSLPQTLAAYNAGPSAAKTWTNKMPSLVLDTFIESISYKETRDYVKKVLGSVTTYRWLSGGAKTDASSAQKTLGH